MMITNRLLTVLTTSGLPKELEDPRSQVLVPEPEADLWLCLGKLKRPLNLEECRRCTDNKDCEGRSICCPVNAPCGKTCVEPGNVRLKYLQSIHHN